MNVWKTDLWMRPVGSLETRDPTSKRGSSVEFVLLSLLFLIQPCLDWLSYAMNLWALPVQGVTALRGLLFVSVCIWGFKGCRTKGSRIRYSLICVVIGGFWLLHIGLSRLSGFPMIGADLANYIKFIQMPVFLIAFLNLLRRASFRGIDGVFTAFLWIFWGYLLMDGLAWFTGTGEYSYTILRQGFLGWYFLANAQSILLALLFPLSLYALVRLALAPLLRAGLFGTTAILGSIRLFYFGTRVTFAALLGSLILLSILLVIHRLPERKAWAYPIFLLVCALCVVVLRAHSPMVQLRSADRVYAQQEREKLQNEVPTLPTKEEGQTPYSIEDLRPLYTYYLPDLVETFGLEPVVRSYDHSLSFITLRDVRSKKIHFAKLRLEQSPPALRWTGLNFSQMQLPGVPGSYDLESDLQAIYLYNGWIGAGLYLLIWLFLLYRMIRCFYKVGFRACFREDRLWVAGYGVGLLAMAAVTSGSVLRRPSVSIYLAFLMAVLLFGCEYLEQKTLQEEGGDPLDQIP